MPLYDRIGQNYAKTRPADSRISDGLAAALTLPVGSRLLDIGAGTGKYSRALADRGYSVMAVEPSEVMRDQSVPHQGVTWVAAPAESIPLSDNSVDGAFIVLALHHFPDRAQAMREILRVIGSGPLVIFTFEPSTLGKIWIGDYFPQLGQELKNSFNRLGDVGEEIGKLTRRKIHLISFPLPRDLQDRFAAALWATPESYLDAEIRNGISSFSLMSEEEADDGLARLHTDLTSGRWDENYGRLRHQAQYDAGYKFIVATHASRNAAVPIDFPPCSP